MNRKYNTLFLLILFGVFLHDVNYSCSVASSVPVPQQSQSWDNFSINNYNLNSSGNSGEATNQAPLIFAPQIEFPKELAPSEKPVNISPQVELPKEENTVNDYSVNVKPALSMPKEEIAVENKIETQAETKSVEIVDKSIKTEKKTKKTEKKTDSISQDKKDALADIRNEAKLLYNANSLDESLKAFQKIPDSEKVSDDWLYLANIAQDKAKEMDAVFYLKKAIQVDDKNYKAHYNLGNIYLAEGKSNMAIDEYSKAVKAKKDFSYAYYNKGCAYLKKNSYFNAKYEFGQAIKLNPDEPMFYYNLAYTYKMMKKDKKAEEVLSIYEKLMQK